MIGASLLLFLQAKDKVLVKGLAPTRLIMFFVLYINHVVFMQELLEMQFVCNSKFKTEINKMSANELRTQPLGKDRLGNAYWFQCDESCQVRVYKEDPDEETWIVVAK